MYSSYLDHHSQGVERAEAHEQAHQRPDCIVEIIVQVAVYREGQAPHVSWEVLGGRLRPRLWGEVRENVVVHRFLQGANECGLIRKSSGA
jgi:hypothetical protein